MTQTVGCLNGSTTCSKNVPALPDLNDNGGDVKNFNGIFFRKNFIPKGEICKNDT